VLPQQASLDFTIQGQSSEGYRSPGFRPRRCAQLKQVHVFLHTVYRHTSHGLPPPLLAQFNPNAPRLNEQRRSTNSLTCQNIDHTTLFQPHHQHFKLAQNPLFCGRSGGQVCEWLPGPGGIAFSFALGNGANGIVRDAAVGIAGLMPRS